MINDKKLEIQIQFLESATDYLNILESVLLEVKGNSQIAPEKINVAIRAAHCIKSGAVRMGFRILSDLAHRLEDVFTVLKTRKNSLEIDPDLHSLLLCGVDWLRQIVKLYSEGHAVDEQWLATFCYPVFQELHERFSYPSEVVSQVKYNKFVELLQSSAFSHRTETQENTGISVKQLEQVNDLLGATDGRHTTRDEWNKHHHSPSSPHSPFPYRRSAGTSLPHSPCFLREFTIQPRSLKMQIERLHKLIRHLSNRVKNIERENHELHLAYEKLTQYQVKNDWELDNSDRTKGVSSKCDSLEIDGCNELHILSQTLIENVVKIQEITTNIQLSLFDTDQVNCLLNKTALALQNSCTQVQMRPLSDLVERFERALRDMSMEYGKNVQLKIEGANILIEHSILEALNEPLMHLLRNVFEYGIEDPATRRTYGKPEQGLIEIKAAHHGNRTLISLRDDGRGISLEKIRARALAIGLAQATDEELLSLIFEPGFSTSEQVTASSSRSLGMDVVHNKLKLVRGDIKVNTVPGVGTTFTLSVPFTV